MKSRISTKAMLLVLLAVVLAACGGDSSSGSPNSTGSPTSTSRPGGSTSTGGAETTTTAPGKVSTQSPCGLFSKGELEEAVGFTLSAGMFSDLTSHGINGSTCFFQADSSNTANVSVTVVTGSQADVFFKHGLPEGGEDLDGIGDKAYLVLGDVQSNLHVLKDDVVATLDIIHGTPVRPDDIDERLTNLAGIAAGRL